MTSRIQSTLANLHTSSASEATLPDVTGWPLDEARPAIETALNEQNRDWPLRLVETAPPLRALKPERPSKAKRQAPGDNARSRPAPVLGMWRVLRCRVIQSTSENIEPAAQPIVELVVAREIATSDTASCTTLSAPSHSI